MEEERRTLRLSDAFETDTGAGEYEWTATMININSGKNQSIMDSCHVLYEYAVFVAKIKRYRESMELKEAIDLAVRECIEENILRDFLEQHRREVCDMCLTEFDEKKYEDGTVEKRVAYEVSVSSLEIANQDGNEEENRGICVRTGGGLWSCTGSPETESFRRRI